MQIYRRGIIYLAFCTLVHLLIGTGCKHNQHNIKTIGVFALASQICVKFEDNFSSSFEPDLPRPFLAASNSIPILENDIPSVPGKTKLRFWAAFIPESEFAAVEDWLLLQAGINGVSEIVITYSVPVGKDPSTGLVHAREVTRELSNKRRTQCVE